MSNGTEGEAYDSGLSGDYKDESKDNYFNVQKFENLLARLEGSKGRQQRQKSVEGRRDTWAAGLANMMTNF
tara:strand:+ start:2725 stop:2937 length:213 start_codon:yes stop_codon:yes gene_type:complete